MPKLSASDPLKFGSKVLIGVDEAGRGPLAGPVVAAAVILPDWAITGRTVPEGLLLKDSKKLSAAQRERQALLIKEHALGYAVAFRSASEIDSSNILACSLDAMRECIEALSAVHDVPVVIDGNQYPVKPAPGHHFTVVKADARVSEVAAASILAKVARDEYMVKLDKTHPQYGFGAHQGYGTEKHMAALKVWGPCEEHRKSFRPVADWIRLCP